MHHFFSPSYPLQGMSAENDFSFAPDAAGSANYAETLSEYWMC